MGTAGSVGRCCQKYEVMREEDPLQSPQHLFALRTLAISVSVRVQCHGIRRQGLRGSRSIMISPICLH